MPNYDLILLTKSLNKKRGYKIFMYNYILTIFYTKIKEEENAYL